MFGLFSKPAPKFAQQVTTRIDVKELYRRLEGKRPLRPVGPAPAIPTIQPAALPVVLPELTDSQNAILASIEETLADIG